MTGQLLRSQRMLQVTAKIIAASWAFFFAAGAVAWANCPASLTAEFQKAVAARALELAREAEDKLNSAPGCAAEDVKARDSLETLEVALIQDLSTDQAVRNDALADVQANGRSWQNAASLADHLLSEHKPAEASQMYDRAIALAAGPLPISEAQRQTLLARAGAAKLLASNDDEGRKPATFARSLRGANGAVGGIYSRSMRGLKLVKIPLPLSFTSGTAIFTENGEKAAAELIEALRQQRPAWITLVGHTDPRGPDDYNLQLSFERARRVASFVRQALAKDRIKIDVQLVAKGKSEPFDAGVLPYRASEEELWALDRRVELVR